MHRLSIRAPRLVRSALILAGVLSALIVGAQITSAQPAQASSWLRYQRGYYLDRGWMCYGWANGAYHCTQHWYRTASGSLVSINTAWVPNGLSSTGSGAVVAASASSTTSTSNGDFRDQGQAAPRQAPAPRQVIVPQQQITRPVAPAPQPRPAYVPASTSSVANEIRAVFGPYAWGALRVAQCESGLNPGAYNPISIGGSHAAGVFQILYPSTWNGTSYRNASPYNASANIRAAYEIFVRDGYSWREWSCKP